MSTVARKKPECRGEEIVAYLDGELEGAPLALLEEHLKECPDCSAELKMQRRLMRELDLSFSSEHEVEMPQNFAQVVAARAQSDVSGVRNKRERRLAAALCVILAAISVALLGGAAVRDSILAPLRAVWKGTVALLNFLGHALYDAGAGFAVISRGVGGHLVFDSRLRALLVLLLFVSALFTLRRLIARYHTRARAIE
ncbi:MAG TPA: zf-HC2 domain-containing protein [Pyrinomonadaceae bacterium]